MTRPLREIIRDLHETFNQNVPDPSREHVLHGVSDDYKQYFLLSEAAQGHIDLRVGGGEAFENYIENVCGNLDCHAQHDSMTGNLDNAIYEQDRQRRRGLIKEAKEAGLFTEGQQLVYAPFQSWRQRKDREAAASPNSGYKGF